MAVGEEALPAVAGPSRGRPLPAHLTLEGTAVALAVRTAIASEAMAEVLLVKSPQRRSLRRMRLQALLVESAALFMVMVVAHLAVIPGSQGHPVVQLETPLEGKVALRETGRAADAPTPSEQAKVAMPLAAAGEALELLEEDLEVHLVGDLPQVEASAVLPELVSQPERAVPASAVQIVRATAAAGASESRASPVEAMEATRAAEQVSVGRRRALAAASALSPPTQLVASAVGLLPEEEALAEKASEVQATLAEDSELPTVATTSELVHPRRPILLALPPAVASVVVVAKEDTRLASEVEEADFLVGEPARH